MALVTQRAAAMRRRVTGISLVADVGVSLFLGLAIASVIGWIVFIIGLIVTGVIYFNFTQVMKTRGYR